MIAAQWNRSSRDEPRRPERTIRTSTGLVEVRCAEKSGEPCGRPREGFPTTVQETLSTRPAASRTNTDCRAR